MNRSLLLLFCMILKVNITFCSDTLSKRARFFISTYPSNLFVGDISLGGEFCFKKIGGEVIFMKKIFESNYYPFYDKGYRISTYIKFKVVNQEKISLSIDAGFIARKEYFENKNLPPHFYTSFSTSDESTLYNQSFMDKYSGLSFGTSSIFKIYKAFNFGWSLNIDVLNVTRIRKINYFESGEDYRNTGLWPSEISKDFPSKNEIQFKNWIYPNLLLKLCIRIK
jgi:hypothetical protein